MIRRVGVFAAWVMATVVALAIAANAVGSVRGQVTDVPALPASGPVSLPAETTTSTATTTSTTQAPGATTSTTEATTTTSSTTTSTTLAPPAVTRYRLQGGEVTISALEPDVLLVAAVPFAGFSVEAEDSGPDKVRVSFESEHHESSFRAEWEGGELVVDIEEEPEGD